MGVKQNVFPSQPERANFLRLKRRWEGKLSLYANLPFLFVFNTKELSLVRLDSSGIFPVVEEVKVNDIQFGRLKKTSIDYTLCDYADRPIVCIEFDGMQEGVNFGTQYITDYQSETWRKTITELKLKIAHASKFPYFVVSSSEFEAIDESLELTIVDGIIGEVLSEKAGREEQQKGFDLDELGITSESFELLSSTEQTEHIGEWFESRVWKARSTFNPIVAEIEQLGKQLGVELWGTEFLRLNQNEWANNKFARQEQVGAKESVTSKGITKSAAVWLPNFLTPGLVNSWELCRQIARLLALKSLERHVSSDAHDSD